MEDINLLKICQVLIFVKVPSETLFKERNLTNDDNSKSNNSNGSNNGDKNFDLKMVAVMVMKILIKMVIKIAINVLIEIFSYSLNLF